MSVCDDSVTGIIPALAAGADVVFAAQDVDEFAFALQLHAFRQQCPIPVPLSSVAKQKVVAVPRRPIGLLFAILVSRDSIPPTAEPDSGNPDNRLPPLSYMQQDESEALKEQTHLQ